MTSPRSNDLGKRGSPQSDEELVEEFARRCRFMLEHHGEVHEASVNLPRLAGIEIGPMKIHASGEEFEQMSVGSLWPPHAQGPITFFRVGYEHKEDVCNLVVIEEYIKILRQRMVLEDMSEIAGD